MSKNKAIKKPIYTAEELNSNIAYGMTTINNITQAELNSIQWLCEKSMNDDIKIKNLQSQLTITEKALELACKEITGSCEYCSYKTRIECPVEADCLDEKINYFKTKAKDMLENE